MNIVPFLHANSRSEYPFVPGTYTGSLVFKPEWIVDLDLRAGAYADYVYSDYVYLVQVISNGSTVSFVFRITDTVSIKFTFAVSAAFGFTAWAYGYNNEDPDTLDWNYAGGFLQVGDLSWYASNTGTWNVVYAVQPGRITTASGVSVSAINLGNQTTQTYNPYCAATASSGDGLIQPQEIVRVSVPLLGSINFSGGYNTKVVTNSDSNTLTVSVVSAAEEGEELPCNPLSKLSYAVGGAPDLTTTCRDVITAINGVRPDQTTGNFVIQGGTGVDVQPVATNAIRITIDQHAIIKPKEPAGADLIYVCGTSGAYDPRNTVATTRSEFYIQPKGTPPGVLDFSYQTFNNSIRFQVGYDPPSADEVIIFDSFVDPENPEGPLLTAATLTEHNAVITGLADITDVLFVRVIRSTPGDLFYWRLYCHTKAVATPTGDARYLVVSTSNFYWRFFNDSFELKWDETTQRWSTAGWGPLSGTPATQGICQIFVRGNRWWLVLWENTGSGTNPIKSAVFTHSVVDTDEPPRGRGWQLHWTNVGSIGKVEVFSAPYAD